LYTFTKFIFLK